MKREHAEVELEHVGSCASHLVQRRLDFVDGFIRQQAAQRAERAGRGSRASSGCGSRPPAVPRARRRCRRPRGRWGCPARTSFSSAFSGVSTKRSASLTRPSRSVSSAALASAPIMLALGLVRRSEGAGAVGRPRMMRGRAAHCGTGPTRRESSRGSTVREARPGDEPLAVSLARRGARPRECAPSLGDGRLQRCE